jgi:hypothetical protein
MDKKTLDAISIAIERGIAQRMAEAERWLTADELIAQFGCFSKSWLKNYGHLLPRTQAIVCEPDGTEHRSPWCYPCHKIAQMLADGSIKGLKTGTSTCPL